ncbi:protocatechuate 4,5-dioxygenase subunit alpha [Egicoccus sp. AB-alg2]|uniref:protocatechuate 4,5-dioxygenase subunit alpha n=1 Tax=Egicoccus sp. AB-alg2 TaxID=3242693 RepID=UPI00359E6E2C
MTSVKRDYDDIPGTYVFDGRRARQGYALNKFLKTLDDPEVREVFRRDEAGYLDRFSLSEEQRRAVLERDWNGLLELGGNVFYIWKLCVFDGCSMQYMGGQMSGMSEDEFRQMMLDGGRRQDG